MPAPVYFISLLLPACDPMRLPAGHKIFPATVAGGHAIVPLHLFALPAFLPNLLPVLPVRWATHPVASSTDCQASSPAVAAAFIHCLAWLRDSCCLDCTLFLLPPRGAPVGAALGGLCRLPLGPAHAVLSHTDVMIPPSSCHAKEGGDRGWGLQGQPGTRTRCADGAGRHLASICLFMTDAASPTVSLLFCSTIPRV